MLSRRRRDPEFQDRLFNMMAPLRELQNTMDTLFGDLYRWPESSAQAFQQGRALLSPALNCYRSGNDLVVECALPGVRKEDIEITLNDDVLTISGQIKSERQDKGEHYYHREIQQGEFQRSIRLPVDVKTEEVKATFQEGVLKINLVPVEDQKAREKRVPIE